MKNILIVLFIAIILFSACKKGGSGDTMTDSDDPFENTNFSSVLNYNVVLDANDNIREYTVESESSGNTTQYVFHYYGDTLAEKEIYENGVYIKKYIYYLNSNGYADSVYTCNSSGDLFFYKKYTYTSSGFLYSISDPDIWSTNPYVYDSFNLVSSGIFSNYDYGYTETIARVDVLFEGRAMDNELTGKNNRNLIEYWQWVSSDNSNASESKKYYYTLNSDGYVTRYIEKRTSNDGYGNVSAPVFRKYNFTYQIVP